MKTWNALDEQLIDAASWGETDKVQALLAAGADVEARDEDDLTALMQAARLGRIEVVQALLAAGADVNARTMVGWKALCSDWPRLWRATVDLLAPVSVWFFAVCACWMALSWALGPLLWTLLGAFGGLCAVWVWFVIRVVLSEAQRCETALMIAARRRNEEVIRALIAGGANAVYDAAVLRLRGQRDAADAIFAARKRGGKARAGRGCK